MCVEVVGRGLTVRDCGVVGAVGLECAACALWSDICNPIRLQNITNYLSGGVVDSSLAMLCIHPLKPMQSNFFYKHFIATSPNSRLCGWYVLGRPGCSVVVGGWVAPDWCVCGVNVDARQLYVGAGTCW